MGVVSGSQISNNYVMNIAIEVQFCKILLERQQIVRIHLSLWRNL